MTNDEIRMRRLGVQLVSLVTEQMICAKCEHPQRGVAGWLVIGTPQRCKPYCSRCIRLELKAPVSSHEGED